MEFEQNRNYFRLITLDGAPVQILGASEEEGCTTAPINSLVVDYKGVNLDPEWKNCFHRDISWLVLGNPKNVPISLRLDSNFFSLQIGDVEGSQLKEWYRVKGSLLSNTIGNWEQDQGFRWTEEDKWDRRVDLGGLDFTAATNAWHPISFPGEAAGQFTGLAPEVVQVIQRVTNCTVSWVIPPDEKYGALLENGTWDGLVGMVQRGGADFAAAGLAITYQRSTVINFGFAFGDSRSALIMQDPQFSSSGFQVNWTSFISVFSELSWLLIGVALLLVYVAHLAVHGRFLHGNGQQNISNCKMRSMLDSAFPSSSLFNLATRSASTRLLFMTTALASTVLLTYYEGMLTSFMTAKPQVTKIGSLGDTLNSDYTIVLFRGAKQEADLYTAPIGTAKREIYETTIKGNSRSYYESRESVENALWNNRHYALYTSEFSLTGTPGVIRITNLKDAPLDRMALAFAKDSELLDFFNHHIIKVHQSGILNFLKDKWLKKRAPDPICGKREERASPLGYSNLILPTLVFWVGALCAALVSMFESLSKLDGWKICRRSVLKSP